MASSEEKDGPIVVTDEDLQYLAGKLKKEWKDVARNLKIDEGKIFDNTTDNPGDVKEAKYQTLLLWKHKEGKHATYEVLAEALSKANRSDLSNKFQKEGKVRKWSQENETASDEATSFGSILRRTESSTVGEEPVKAGLKSFRQFCLKLESLLTRQHACQLATLFGYASDKVEDISRSDTPGRVLVQCMAERGEISPTDISKLITALENEIGVEDVAEKAREEFELNGKFYHQFVPTLDSILTRPQAVSLAEYFEYPTENIDGIRKSSQPSQRLVDLMIERGEISPIGIFKLISALKHESFKLYDVADKVKEEFEFLQKKIQLQRELRNKYRILCGEFKLAPFLRDKYEIAQFYVDGGIKFLEKSKGNEEQWRLLKDYKTIFTDPKVKSKRRIIDGRPGYGKSTLALQITHDWRQGIALMKDFEILILLRLRQFKNVPTIYGAIKKFLLPRDSKLTENDIKNILDSSPTIVLLDGYDEYPGQHNQESDSENIIQGNMFQNHEVVLTTRTSCLPPNYPSHTTHIRLTGFNASSGQTFIRKVVARDCLKGASSQFHEVNPVSVNFSEIPLFVAMIFYIAATGGSQYLETATQCFQRIIRCFHTHNDAKLKDEDRERELNHKMLCKVAFEGLSGDAKQISWGSGELSTKVGHELYREYVCIGILIEDESFDFKTSDNYTETRFFHKLFQEWYAAHYLADLAARPEAVFINTASVYKSWFPVCSTLSQTFSSVPSLASQPQHATKLAANPIAIPDPRDSLAPLEEYSKSPPSEGSQSQKAANDEYMISLKNLDPQDVNYMYCFACGLNSEAAVKIINHLGIKMGCTTHALLCIAEWKAAFKEDLKRIEHFVKSLCSGTIDIMDTDRLLSQKTTLAIVGFASDQKIPVMNMELHNCLNVTATCLSVKPSNLPLPVINTTLKKLKIVEDGRVISKEETKSILQHLAMCQGLKNVIFVQCLFPQSIILSEHMVALRSKGVTVQWCIHSSTYRLDLHTGQWDNYSLIELRESRSLNIGRIMDCSLVPEHSSTLMTDRDYQEAVESAWDSAMRVIGYVLPVKRNTCLGTGCYINLDISPSNLSPPVIITREEATLRCNSGLTQQQTDSLIQHFVLQGPWLKEVEFYGWLFSWIIKDTEPMLYPDSRHVIVSWFLASGTYRLNLRSGQWEHSEHRTPMTDEQYRRAVQELPQFQHLIKIIREKRKYLTFYKMDSEYVYSILEGFEMNEYPKEIRFHSCVPPEYIAVPELMRPSGIGNVKIWWNSGSEDYLLNLDSGIWEDHGHGTPMTNEQYQRVVDTVWREAEIPSKRVDVNCQSNIGGKPSKLSSPFIISLSEEILLQPCHTIRVTDFLYNFQVSELPHLREVQFHGCSLPKHINMVDYGLSQENLKVEWFTETGNYILNLKSGQWEHIEDRKPMTDEQYNKAILQLKTVWTKAEIPLKWVRLKTISDRYCDDHSLIMSSHMPPPVIVTLEEVLYDEPLDVITMNLFQILPHEVMPRGYEIQYHACLLPRISPMPDFIGVPLRDLPDKLPAVRWILDSGEYLLNFTSGQWEHFQDGAKMTDEQYYRAVETIWRQAERRTKQKEGTAPKTERDFLFKMMSLPFHH